MSRCVLSRYKKILSDLPQWRTIFQALDNVPEDQRNSILDRIFSRYPRTQIAETPRTPPSRVQETAVLQTPASSTHSQLWLSESVVKSPQSQISCHQNSSSLGESKFLPTESGVGLSTIDIHLTDGPRRPLLRGTLQLQQFSIQHEGFLKLQYSDGLPKLLAVLHRQFDIPQLKVPPSYDPLEKDEQEFEQLLNALAKSHSSYEYLVAMGHYSEIRQNLGLPEPGFYPGERLLRAAKHIPGLQSEYLYISKGLAVAAIHKEDMDLDSKNFNYAGCDKLWLVVSPSSSMRFESLMVQSFQLEPHCSQFVRHLECIPFPSWLKQHGLRFRVVRQKPGQAVEISSGAYHAIVTLGESCAGAINCSPDDWNPPLLYKSCNRKCFDFNQIKVQDFRPVGEPRALDVVDDWEIASTPLTAQGNYSTKGALETSPRRSRRDRKSMLTNSSSRAKMLGNGRKH